MLIRDILKNTFTTLLIPFFVIGIFVVFIFEAFDGIGDREIRLPKSINLIIKILITLLILSPFITFADDLFKPLFPESKINCSTAEIVRILPDNYKERIETVNTAVNQISNELKVDACLILSMVWVESTFKVSQRSFKGANGLLQVMPRTHKAMVLKLDYKLNKMVTSTLSYDLKYDEIENLIIGTYYYSKLLKKFKGNTKKAVIAYNTGAKFVLNNKVTVNHPYFKKVKNKLDVIAINN
jgi:hypothetical protein